MNKVLLTFLGILLTSGAYANFSLDNVKSISCIDLMPTSKAQVEFWTDGPGANKFVRQPGEIPYAHGNMKNKMGSFQAGVLSLANDPAAEGGVISLLDKADAVTVTTALILYPTLKAQKYVGVLTSGISVDEDWVEIKNQPMSCVLTLM